MIHIRIRPITEASSDDKNHEKVVEFCNWAYHQCVVGFHEHYTIQTCRAVTGELYLMKANYPTGMISVNALEQLQKGVITRKKLTHEHFHSRTRIGLDLIRDFNTNYLIQPPSVIISKMVETAKRGLQTHYVLSEENNALAPIQKKYSDLTWEDHYAMCGIILTQDPGVPQFQYSYLCPIREERIVFATQTEAAERLKVSKSTIGKWVQRGLLTKEEICQSQNKLQNNLEKKEYVSSQMTTSRNSCLTSPLKTSSPRSLADLTKFFEV